MPPLPPAGTTCECTLWMSLAIIAGSNAIGGGAAAAAVGAAICGGAICCICPGGGAPKLLFSQLSALPPIPCPPPPPLPPLPEIVPGALASSCSTSCFPCAA